MSEFGSECLLTECLLVCPFQKSLGWSWRRFTEIDAFRSGHGMGCRVSIACHANNTPHVWRAEGAGGERRGCIPKTALRTSNQHWRGRDTLWNYHTKHWENANKKKRSLNWAGSTQSQGETSRPTNRVSQLTPPANINAGGAKQRELCFVFSRCASPRRKWPSCQGDVAWRRNGGDPSRPKVNSPTPKPQALRGKGHFTDCNPVVSGWRNLSF